MSDDLRSALESAVEEHSEPEAPSSSPEAIVSPATPESAPAPSSSEAVGEEVSAETTAERGSPDKPKPIDEVVAEKPAEEKPAIDPRIDRAPQSWKGDSKKVWAELPLNVRQEVVRRERETTKVMQEAAHTRQQMSQVQEALAPHMDRINSVYGGNSVQAINNLLVIERRLFNDTPADKAQLMANMIKQFNIDLPTLDALLSGQPASDRKSVV